MKITPPIFATVTPFGADGAIDYYALERYLAFLKERGVGSILVNGTTGEFSSLTISERKDTLEFCRKHFDGAVINNVSSCSYRDVLDLARHSAGRAEAILMLPPFYYANPSDRGVFDFFSKVLKRSQLKALLYNFPKHTQVALKPEFVRRLAGEFDTLIGIKDSGKDFDVSLSYKRTAPDFKVFVGTDSRALEVLKLGLDGTVSGGANPVPELLIALYEGFTKGNAGLTHECQIAFQRWNSFKVTFPEISLVKMALSLRIDKFPIHLRPPLLEVSSNERSTIKTRLSDCLS